uniref:Uncharacterized protein n=1 Tax=Helianthus annuus TaxID=4232 RepID=A0A251THJ9_HELAN
MIRIHYCSQAKQITYIIHRWLDKMPFDFLFILLFILSYLLASIPDYHWSLRKCSKKENEHQRKRRPKNNSHLSCSNNCRSIKLLL